MRALHRRLWIKTHLLFTATSILKRQKQLRRKNVRFDQVTVYYFARRQGFTSVPSQGGSSLGMAQRHNSVRSYTLCEFAQEQEVNHREILREHLKEEKLHAKKMKVPVGMGSGASVCWVQVGALASSDDVVFPADLGKQRVQSLVLKRKLRAFSQILCLLVISGGSVSQK